MRVTIIATNELFANAVVNNSLHPQLLHEDEDIKEQYPMLKGRELEIDEVISGVCSANVLTKMPYNKAELDVDDEYEHTDNFYFKVQHTEDVEIDFESTSDVEVERVVREKFPHVNMYSKIEVEFEGRRVA